jgi:hypothetical protein
MSAGVRRTKRGWWLKVSVFVLYLLYQYKSTTTDR